MGLRWEHALLAYGPALDAQGNFYVTLDGNTVEWNPRWKYPFAAGR